MMMIALNAREERWCEGRTCWSGESERTEHLLDFLMLQSCAVFMFGAPREFRTLSPMAPLFARPERWMDLHPVRESVGPDAMLQLCGDMQLHA